MVDDYSLAFDQLTARVSALGAPRYRAGQVFEWLHRHLAPDYEAMANIPRALRADLAREALPLSHPVEQWERGASADKALFAWDDGACVESVLMRRPWGTTACLSTQSGCPIGCLFCASGAEGFSRNLTSGEIVRQAIELRRVDPTLRRVVFMGVGEPLLNYDALCKAITIFVDHRGWGVSERNITVSTVGIIEKIAQLAGEEFRVRLAISLHAPWDELRAQIVPHYRRPIRDIIAAAGDYQKKTGRRVSYEYVLLKDVNDGLRDAQELGKLLRATISHVNLLTYNESDAGEFYRSPPARAAAFQAELQSQGVRVSLRRSVGGEVRAACGQLRARSSGARLGQTDDD